MRKGVGGHQRAYKGFSDEWLTPPHIIEALAPFDLDPCSPINRPWPTADQHFTTREDGLAQEWPKDALAFVNPPYGPETAKWLKKLAEHNHGIALVFARTETAAFHDHVWPKAMGLLFLKGRLFFHDLAGRRAKCNSGAPSVLISYGSYATARLSMCKIPGSFVSI